MNDDVQVSQDDLQNKIREEAERYLNIYRPVHGHLVLDDQYMKQIKASLEYGLLTRILNDVESVDVDYLNQLIERLGESLTASTEFKLSELSNAISSVNNQVSSLDIQAIRDSIAAEIYTRCNSDGVALGLRLKALEDALGNLSNTSNNATRDLHLELVSITDGINSRVSAFEQTIVNKTADDILLASKVSQLEAIYEDNNKRLLARIREENESRINGYEALTQQLTTMVSQVNNSSSSIEDIKRTYANLDQAYSERISSLESTFRESDEDIKATLKEQTRTLTNANKALAEKVTNLETNIDGKIGAKFNETIETISSKEEALARRISELNTSFLGLDGKLEGTIREEIKSVSDANKVHLSKIEELEGKTETTLGRIESLQDSIITPEQVTNIVSDEMVAKYSNTKDKILDTRDTNELPRYYYENYPNALAKEVKLSAVIGIKGEGELGYLETQTIGTNYREGRVTQVFYSEDGDTYKRVSITEDIWNVWKLQETDESAKEKLRLALLEIQQKITDSEARIEDYNKTHSDATKALAESIKQLEADYKEGDRVVNSRIVTQEQVQSTVDSASAETLQQLTSALDEVKGSIRTLQSTVTNPDGTVAVSEEMIRSLIIDETKIKDTKGVNSTPEWYVNNHLGKSTKELETSKVIGLTQNGDAYLETNVLSATVSKGSVKQEAVTEDGKIYTRHSTGLREWSEWVESESSVTASDRLLRAKEELEREISKVSSEFTEYKKTKATEDAAEALRIQGLSTKLDSDYGTLLGKIKTEESSRLSQDASINKRIDNISSDLAGNFATIKSVNETKATLTESIAKKGEEITSGFDSKLIKERDITNLAIQTSADDVTKALVSKIDEYKNVANSAKSTIDDYKRTNDNAVRALGERQNSLTGEYTQAIVDAKVEMQGVIDTTKDDLQDSIDLAESNLKTSIGQVRSIATQAKSDIASFEKTLNDATASIAKTNRDMSSRFTATETLITVAKDDAIRLAKEGAIDLINGAKTELKKYSDSAIKESEKTQADKNSAFAKKDAELQASISSLPTTKDVEAKVSVEREARVTQTEALVKQITKGSVKYPNGTGNVNEVSTVLNDIIKATADSSFVDKSSTLKATVHREVDEKMFRDAGNLLTDTINYSTWEYGKHTSETIVPRLVNGVWELNGTTNNYKEIMLFSKEGSILNNTAAQESLVQVSEGSEYILEFEAKGNTSLIVIIRVFYKVGTTSRSKQITSTVSLNSTWTKHRVKVKCPELEGNEVRDFVGVYFQSVTVGNIEIRKPRMYLDPSVLNAAIKEYKQMNLDMKGNLDAKIGLTVNSQNRVTGWIATDKNNSSEFNIMADSFKISNSSNTSTPFSIDNTGNIVFNGKVNFNNVQSTPVIPSNADITRLAKAEADKKDEAINAVGNRIGNLAVGGRNLLKNSSPNMLNANYAYQFELTTAPSVGDEVVVTLWGNMGADRTGIGVYNTQGYTELSQLVKIKDGVYQGKGLWRLPMNGSNILTPNNTHLNVYFYPSTASSTNRIDKIKLEKGNIATDWTPAPEDTDAKISDVNITISNLKIPNILTAQGSHINDNNAWMKVNSHTGSRTLGYTGSEGIVVQVLNQTTLVVELTKVYPKTTAGYLSMKNDLTAVATNRIAMTVSRTNVPIVNDNNLRDALRRVGSTDLIYNTLTKRTNNTFALIGRVGVEGSAYESIVDTSGSMYGQLASVSAIWDAGELLPSNQTMIDGGRITTNSITANQIAANTITANEINTDAIQARHINAGSIDTNKIAANAIRTNHISASVINASHISSGSIATDHIQAKSIKVDKIADAAITNAKIADAAINTAKIENGAITNAKIGNAAIKNANIENGAITTAKIGTAQVDTLQIKGEAVVIPRLQYSEFQEFYDIDTEVEVNRVSLDTQGGAVSISFGFDVLEFRARNTDSNDGVVNLRIKRGNTVLRYREFPVNCDTVETVKQVSSTITRPKAGYGSYGQIIFLTFLDVPPSGEQVYTVTLESRRLNSGLSPGGRAAHPVKIHRRSLHIMGVKR